MFQRIQNIRGAGAGEGAARPGRPNAGARPGGEGRGGGVQGAGLAGAASIAIEMDAALERARRRRAARAVFGPGFGGLDDGEEDEPRAPQREEFEHKQQDGPEEKAGDPGYPTPGAQASNASLPSRRAEAKLVAPSPPRDSPAAETGGTRPPPSSSSSDAKQADDHHDDRYGPHSPPPADERSDGGGGGGQGVHPAEAGEEAAVDGDDRRRSPEPGGRRRRTTDPEIVPEKAAPSRAECKRPGDGDGAIGEDRAGGNADDERKAGERESGGEEAAIDVVGEEEEKPAAQSSAGTSPSEGGDGGGGGGVEVRGKVDLGVDDGWFQKFEAKMGAIKKQVRVFRVVKCSC